MGEIKHLDPALSSRGKQGQVVDGQVRAAKRIAKEVPVQTPRNRGKSIQGKIKPPEVKMNGHAAKGLEFKMAKRGFWKKTDATNQVCLRITTDPFRVDITSEKTRGSTEKRSKGKSRT